ncbi:hypothetical protein FSP39_009550 [Pinctada imbricata]|uniref:Uncharacterized protein n=1 Tax=Pinctada imbricata TaxID=66713 RepID=A0AA88Y8B9_PINIB|nr:hypothetical protein FSP39_009550 [Pinctada imbricata]
MILKNKDYESAEVGHFEVGVRVGVPKIVTSRGMSTLTKEEVKALQRKCQGLGVFLTVISFAGVVGYWKMDGFNSCVDMKMPVPMVVSAVDPKTGEEEESS